MNNFKHFIVFLGLQVVQLIEMAACAFAFCYIIPIFPLFIIILFAVTISINRKLYQDAVCIKSKKYWTCCFIPIFLVYLVLIAVFVYLSCLNTNFVVGIGITALSMIIFIASSAMAVNKCPNCGKGIGILKLSSMDVVREWKKWEENGTRDEYQTVTFSDSSGNTYSGRINEKTVTNYIRVTYQQRNLHYICKCCGRNVKIEKTVKKTLLRRLMDVFNKE